MHNREPTAHEKARLSRIVTLRTWLPLVSLSGCVASLVLPLPVAVPIILAGLAGFVYLTCGLRCPRCSGWIVIPKCPSCGLELGDE
jgi:hypothetical protein